MLQQLRRQWFVKHQWGSQVDAPPVFDDGSDENIAKVLLTCVNGDGEITQAERDWILGFFSSAGFSDSVVEKLSSYSAEEDIGELIAQYPYLHAAPGMIIYTALLACDSDGELHPDEVTTVRRMAHVMGASDDMIDDFIQLIHEEKQLRAKRINIAFPNGVPF